MCWLDVWRRGSPLPACLQPDRALREERALSNAPVVALVGNQRLILPESLIRVTEQRGGGPLARLDLALDAQTLLPAGGAAHDAADPAVSS